MSLCSSRYEKYFSQICTKVKTLIFCAVIFFSENRAFCGIIMKYLIQPNSTQMTVCANAVETIKTLFALNNFYFLKIVTFMRNPLTKASIAKTFF